MRNSLVFVVMSSLIAMTGCAADAPSTADDTHGFTRGADGEAVQANVSELAEATQAFDHEMPRDSVAAESDAVSCSGACNANVCVCSGDFNCCAIGCGICFVLAN